MTIIGTEEDDDIDDIADGLFERLKCVPKFDEKGIYHYGKCTCGGTIKAIRSTYNGHLHAECNNCDFKLHE